MSDILEKIRKALEMAASSDEEEARTAAMIAARMIREYKVELVLPGTIGSRPIDPRVRMATDLFGAVLGYAVERSNPALMMHSPAVRRGTCTVCGHMYARGEPVYWRRDPFYRAHEGCHNKGG